MFEFHISRQAHDRYGFDQSLFAFNGNVIFANFHAVRLFVQKINQKRDLAHFPEQALRAGQINAMGLIDEILHYVLGLYRQQKKADVMLLAYEFLRSQLGENALELTLLRFTEEFPPFAVYQQELTADEYLNTSSEGIPNRVIALEELLLLWVSNKNPANAPYLEFFDDSTLQSETAYITLINNLHDFFDSQPLFGPEPRNLMDMLRSSAIAMPHSLTDQLEFIRTHWAALLGRFLYRLLSSQDLVKEEEKMTFGGIGGGDGPFPIPVYDLASGALGETENFTKDREWMPRLVLMAKNTYVWLSQLSKKYNQSITRLDQIPDSELEYISHSGMTGLWLIGIWERSQASARIKQLCGNSEAIASAYSVADYQIAADLGGEDAYQNLHNRAWHYGIRLASDMVPNHMGIDSDWVLYRPERFISLEYSPFPSYTFNGPDLSSDEHIGIHLEDHYYSRSDAAVVFKREDYSTGQVQYIYHGNDGTSMPWNDTAQLNYLNPEVREAIIQTILDVAHKFPIIRFDAAMTLAKRQYQRLWFPEPGSGGDIPSRAEHGLTRQQFDALMPMEFWREVVERAAVEIPDTLLLAEAFWMMEGYFVRTLGMHRVYNSAFMNLLRNEENDKYHLVIKNTLEFDPEILKRYVNFMNNPDERTAVDQFGKGDKYFGICMLMVTMPGLPMFGHGQVDGFAEKYGMEFRRPHWEEEADSQLVARHEKEIFPLLHRRTLFAGIENFLLYDFFTPEGSVNEDVFAFSNQVGEERALVIYHNRSSSTRGWIKTSAAYLTKSEVGDQPNLVQRSLAEGLSIPSGADFYVIFRDQISNLEYIRPAAELIEKGLYFELNAYEYHAFVDFSILHDDDDKSYLQLCHILSGRGVPSVKETMQELALHPVQHPFKEIANPGYFQYLLSAVITQSQQAIPAGLLNEAQIKMHNLLDGIEAHLQISSANKQLICNQVADRLGVVLTLTGVAECYPLPGSRVYPLALEAILTGVNADENRIIIFSAIFIAPLGELISSEDYESQTLSWLDEWGLGKILSDTYQQLGFSEEKTGQMIRSVRLLIGQQDWYKNNGRLPVGQILGNWLSDSEVQNFLGVNRFKDILWFNKEPFREFNRWMLIIASLQNCSYQTGVAPLFVESVLASYEIYQQLNLAVDHSDFQVSKLLDAVAEVDLEVNKLAKSTGRDTTSP